MKNRIKLTSKVAMIISLLIGILWFVITLFLRHLYARNHSGSIWVVFILVVVMCVITMVSYWIIYRIFNVEKAEKREHTFPSKDVFTEVFYRASNAHNSKEEMILSILQTEKIRFFAKLTEDNDIFLVVKNKNNEEIYSCEISNYDYIEKHFF